MAEFKANGAAQEPSMGDKKELCRLCLRHDKSNTNIFEEVVTLSTATLEQKKITLSEHLFDLLKIKFERSALLPDNICQRCLSMVEAIRHFRHTVQICENELQGWLQQAKERMTINSADQLPGVNGNPDVLESRKGNANVVVDPEQDDESSDDDFSMESDSDMEFMPLALPSNPTNGAEQPSQQHEQPKISKVSIISVPDELNTPQLNVAGPQNSVSTPSLMEPNKYLQSSLTYNADIHGSGRVVKNTFFCQFCDMAFATKRECTDHESQHDDDAPYSCILCSLCYTTRQLLINHMREVHDPIKPNLCVVCRKFFGRRSDLKKHTILHTGVRPFTCTVCNKSFARNTSLTKHIRIHRGDKPHVCHQCPRSFSTAIEVLQHARTHAVIKRFPCERCPASFTRRYKLGRHLQSHNRREAELLTPPSK